MIGAKAVYRSWTWQDYEQTVTMASDNNRHILAHGGGGDCGGGGSSGGQLPCEDFLKYFQWIKILMTSASGFWSHQHHCHHFIPSSFCRPLTGTWRSSSFADHHFIICQATLVMGSEHWIPVHSFPIVNFFVICYTVTSMHKLYFSTMFVYSVSLNLNRSVFLFKCFSVQKIWWVIQISTLIYPSLLLCLNHRK